MSPRLDSLLWNWIYLTIRTTPVQACVFCKILLELHRQKKKKRAKLITKKKMSFVGGAGLEGGIMDWGSQFQGLYMGFMFWQ